MSSQFAKSMNKSKCCVCSQLPHLSKNELPLSAVPFSGEDISGYLDRRQAIPVLSRVGGTGRDVSAKVLEIIVTGKRRDTNVLGTGTILSIR